jgi:iron complex outermembrane receptor protein
MIAVATATDGCSAKDRCKPSSVSAWALGGTLALATAPALGQETLGRVEITGSAIKRAEIERASAVQVITRDDIDKSAKTTVAAYLQTLTSTAGSVPTTFGRGFAAGSAAGICCADWGQRNLVLINGRRVAPSVLADDAQLLRRPEHDPARCGRSHRVPEGGASVIYGSDPVAGVVNIILRKTLQRHGSQGVVRRLGRSDEGESAWPFSMASATSTRTGTVLLNLDATRTEAIYYRDRVGRGTVGKSALYGLGFAPGDNSGFNVSRMAGNGSIPVDPATGRLLRNMAGNSIIGSVRDPLTGPLDPAGNPTNPNLNNYYSRGNPAGAGFTRTFPAAQAQCDALANLPQNVLARAVTDLWRNSGRSRQPERQLLRPVHPFWRRRGVRRLGLSRRVACRSSGLRPMPPISFPTARRYRMSRRRCSAPLTPTTRMSGQPRG